MGKHKEHATDEIKVSNKQRGSAAIFFMFVAAAASVFFLANINTISDMLMGVKKSQRKSYEMEKFLHGVLNYTVYAVKERWCMSKTWSQDENCGGVEMRDQVLNKLNLERLLWSQTANNAIKEMYEEKYSEVIPENPALDSLTASISISDLAKLELSHPLNLSLSEPIKRCLGSVEINLSRSKKPGNQPVGDEKVILINVRGIKNEAKNCESIPGNPYLNSTVAFYPRTLNQFSVIKAGDLDVGNFVGTGSSKGVRFHNSVYVEKDFILRDSADYRVGFYDTVRIGGGNLRLNSSLYNPKTFGHSDERIYDQFSHVMALKGGVALENKVDEGLSPLFGNTFTYPENTLLSACIARAKLKDNPSLTNDARLWIKGKNGNFTLGLSQNDEFREYSYPFASGKTNEIFAWDDTDKNFSEAEERFLKAEIKNVGTFPYPVIKIGAQLNTNVSGFDQDKEYTSAVLGRDSSATIKLFDPQYLQLLEDGISNKDNIVRSNNIVIEDYPELDGINLKDDRQRFYDVCNEFEDEHKFRDVKNESCKKVHSGFNDPGRDKECSDLSPWDQGYCFSKVNEINSRENQFEDSRDRYLSYMAELKSNPPEVEITLTPDLMNKLQMNIKLNNENKMNNPFVKPASELSLNISAFDFAVEGSSDPVDGKRRRWSDMPGPNEDTNDTSEMNILKMKFNRDYFSKNYYGLSYRNTEGDTITDTNYSTNGWMLLKGDNSFWDNEPPTGEVDGNWVPLIPGDGITIAEAQNYDANCGGTSDASSSEWDVSFTENTQFSWLYSVQHSGVTIDDPSKVTPKPSHTFLEYDMDPTNYKGIPTISIVKECIVPSSIDLVFGFYVCEKLTIEGRSSPLKFIGTFIVKDFNFSTPAINAGIDFFSIWHPLAIEFLKLRGDLKKPSESYTANPKCQFNEPGWSPFLSDDLQMQYLECSPMKFVIQGANNFNWTTVDPEIGIPSSGASATTQAKIPGRYRRYVTSAMWVETGTED